MNYVPIDIPLPMQLITEPKLYLVGRPTVVVPDEGELQDFLDDHDVPAWWTDTRSPAEILCEIAGRLCYMSFGKPRPGGNKAYLDNIIGMGHGSVLEHATWNFIITGVSRSFSHELVRHRAGWAFSQLSQRYVDESVAEYVVPLDLQNEVRLAQIMHTTLNDGVARDPAFLGKLIRDQLPEGDSLKKLTDLEVFRMADAGSQWLNTIQTAHKEYVHLADHLMGKIVQAEYDASCAKIVDAMNYPHGPAPLADWLKHVPRETQTGWRKQARQAARSVLPNATETKVFFTANGRSLRHFLELRGSRHAEPEIRRVANLLLTILQKEAGNLFGDYTTLPLPDGTYEILTSNRKV